MTDARTLVLPRLGAADAGVEDPWGEGCAPAYDAPPRPGSRSWRTAAWLVPAVLMGALGLARARMPALSGDELATWRAAASSWPQTWAASREFDVTPYHLLVWAWAQLAGTSDLALRVPSVLAMAGAAALLGALVARAFTPRVGLLAGVVFALLPASSRYAQEAQSYPLTVFAAVLATWCLARAVARPGRARFAGYGAAVALLGLCHVLAPLLLVGHGWAVLAFRRAVAGRWLMAATLGALPVAVLLWRGGWRWPIEQLEQAGTPGWEALVAAGREVFGAPALAGVLLVLALFSLPLRRAAAGYTAWAVLPPLALLLLGQAGPVWLPEGLLFTLPAWAALGAVALARAGGPLSVAVLMTMVLLGAPQQLAQRASDGHRQASRQLAEIIERGVRPGDGVIYGAADPADGRVGRDLVARYLPPDRRPVDLLAPASPGVGGAAGGCADAARCLRGASRVWVVRLGERVDPLHGVAGEAERLLRTAYRVAQVWRPAGFTLVLLVDAGTDREKSAN